MTTAAVPAGRTRAGSVPAASPREPAGQRRTFLAMIATCFVVRPRRNKELTMENKGPASYFPSIEKKYGQPISYWIGLIHANTELTRHGELVTWLKQDHGLGHGHATALVHHANQHRS